MAAQDVVSSALRGAGFLVGLVAFQRLVSFALNQVLLRNTTPAIFGLVAVQLDLLYATTLFIAREGLRLALLRVPLRDIVDVHAQRHAVARLVNSAWFVVPLAAVLASGFAVFYLWNPPALEVNDYDAAVVLYCIAVVLETVCEPAYVLAQNYMLFGVRVGVEALALVCRAVVAVYFVVHLQQGLLGFAYAQVAYSLACIIGYYGYVAFNIARQSPNFFVTNLWQMTPQVLDKQNQRIVDWDLLTLAFTFTQQSVLKHILTEGDRLVLSFVSTLYDQGVYAVVSNYGSLAARIIFQPIEETSRVMFSKLIQPSSSGDTSSNLVVARSLLTTICKLVMLVGLVFACFGANYTHILLFLLLGEKWASTEAPTVLAWYCLYVFVMALNGVTEAFVYAVADKAEVSRMNYFLMMFSATYAVAGIWSIQNFGTTGLVLANCLNMSLRIAYSIRFIEKFFKSRNQSLRFYQLTPHTHVLLAFAISFGILQIVSSMLNASTTQHPFSSAALPSTALFVALGAVLALIVAAIVYVTERQLLVEALTLARARGRKD